MDKNIVKWVGLLVGLIVTLIVVVILFEVKTVPGNALGIKESFSVGVEDRIYQPKTYFMFPGYSQRIFTYDMTPNTFELEVLDAKSSDNQNVKIKIIGRWHYDPTRLVQIHKDFHTHIDLPDWEKVLEDKAIIPTALDAVRAAVTARTAIEGYSGPGFIAMQKQINDAITDPKNDIGEKGIIVSTTVIASTSLDPEYIGEINKRQVAQQRTLRAQEEEKAALAEAQKAKAEAGADFEKRVVEAKRDAQVQIEASQAEAKKKNNEADAAAYQVTTSARAEREAAEARAAAIMALGKANAEAKRLELSAFAVDGAESFVQIKVAEQMALAFKGIQGYLPSDMKINLLSDNFMNSVKSIVGGRIQAPSVEVK